MIGYSILFIWKRGGVYSPAQASRAEVRTRYKTEQKLTSASINQSKHLTANDDHRILFVLLKDFVYSDYSYTFFIILSSKKSTKSLI